MRVVISSLRARLMLLLLLAALPPTGLIAHSTWQERSAARSEAERQTRQLAGLVAAEQNRLIQEARQMLTTLAHLPFVRDPALLPQCAETLAKIHAQNPLYANIGMVDGEGQLLCSALPFERPINFSDREWFRRAATTRDFAVGDYRVSLLARVPVMNVALPLYGEGGQLQRVLYAPLALSWFGRFAGSLDLPPGSAMVLVDSRGTVLVRHPDPRGEWTGRPSTQNEELQKLLSSDCHGFAELAGIDGVQRLNAVEPLQWVEGRCMYVRVGIPRSEIYAPIERRLHRNVAALLVTVLLIGMIAWQGGELLVLRPVRALTDAARRLGRGELDARTGLPHSREELGVLAHGLDSMAASLQERERRLEEVDRSLSRANRALRVLSAGNRAMLRARDEQGLLGQMCHMIVEQAGYRMAWVGFLEQDGSRRIRPVAHWGFELATLDPRCLSWDEARAGNSATGAAVRLRRPELFRALADADPLSCMRASGCVSALALPFGSDDGTPLGVLSIYSTEADAFDAAEIELLDEAASDLGYGIARLRDRARSQEADEIEDLYNRAPCGYHSLDPDGYFLRINDTELSWLGYRREEVVQRMRFPDLLSPASQQVFAELFPRFKERGWVRDQEFELLRRDGSVLPVLLNATAIRDATGRFVSSRSTVHDITDRRRAEGAMRLAKEAAEETSRVKSEFLANMSHELRTPLNAIIGFSEVLKDGLLGEMSSEQREYVSDIFTSGQHLLSLINDILDLSKIEAGRMSLELEPMDLPALLQGSLAIVKEKAAAHRIQLAMEIPASLGPTLLDARKAKQIVYNLLSNAVKFTPEGGQVRLSAARVPRRTVEEWSTAAPTCLRMPLPDGDFAEFLEITVQDSGIGIAPEQAPQLFHAFSQIDSSLARQAEGTGLGLVLLLKLAQLHGGTVALASAPGEGSRFIVWLPWRETLPPTPAGALNPQAGEPGAARPLALVIEDNLRAAELIRLQLEPEGFEVLVATDASQARQLVEARPPAVIILDILLPDMDGWELLARLKAADSPAAHIPVVIVSIVADTQRGISLGARAVLQKPVSREELLQALQGAGLIGARQAIRVLVADDDPRAQELLAAYLAEPGYTVLRASGGEECIQRARNEHPDLIVLDLMMPEVSGFDVVEALKGSPDTATIPVVVVTAKSLSTEERAQLKGSVMSILEKRSFNHGRFASEVRRAITRRRSSPP